MNTAVATKPQGGEVVPINEKPIAVLHGQLEEMGEKFRAALPAHIPVERFKRVVMTAIQNSPDLIKADRYTLWNAAMRAAQDGLLPDAREGAMVIFRNKVKVNENGREVEKWIDCVQWMPMIAGLRKKVRNSGEIADWNAQVVYQKDKFAYRLGDDAMILHEPYMGPDDPGEIVAAYSIAVLKSGEKSREVMTRREIEKVRAVSKSKDGPAWTKWFSEMARKTVARRHSKVLPMSTDLDDLIRRDDELYDFDGARAEDPPPQRPQMKDFMEAPRPEPERVEEQPAAQQPTSEPEPLPEIGPPEAMERGRADRRANKALRAVPPEWREPNMQALADAWTEGWKAEDDEINAAAKEGKKAQK